MNKWIVSLGIVSVILMSGCIPHSLHPLATPDTVKMDPKIIGAWKATDSDSVWEFQKTDGQAYTLLITDKGKQGEFTAKLVDLDGTLFLDMKPNEMEINHEEYYRWHLVPVHSVIKVQQVNPLVLVPIDYEWFLNTVKDNPSSMDHEKVHWYADSDSETVVITASSQEQQAFWNQHKDNPKAFADPVLFESIE